MCVCFLQHGFVVKICGVLEGDGLEERGPGAGVGVSATEGDSQRYSWAAGAGGGVYL